MKPEYIDMFKNISSSYFCIANVNDGYKQNTERSLKYRNFNTYTSKQNCV